MVEVTRECAFCKVVRPIGEFPVKRNAVGGRGWRCSPCWTRRSGPKEPKPVTTKAPRPKKPVTWRVNYKRYMVSARWYAKRSQALARAGHRCAQCGSDQYLQVHHKTYARLGRELPEDLEVLCGDCHRDEHGIEFDRKEAS